MTEAPGQPWIPLSSVELERERIGEKLRAERSALARAAAARSPDAVVLHSSRDGLGDYEGRALPPFAKRLAAAATTAGWGVTATWSRVILPPGWRRTDRSKTSEQARVLETVAVRLTAYRQTGWAVWYLGVDESPSAGLHTLTGGFRTMGVTALIEYVSGGEGVGHVESGVLGAP